MRNFILGISVTFLFLVSQLAGAMTSKEIVSMVLRSDGSGSYDIVCKDGSTEVATLEDIRLGKVCNGKPPVVSSHIVAMFANPQGKDEFFVLCDRKTWETATTKMLEENKVCHPLCPVNAVAERGKVGKITTCMCPGPVSTQGVWGTDIYTDDSNLCTAGVHVGKITVNGGLITYETKPGQKKYVGSTRNGVASTNYETPNDYPGSFIIK